MFRLNSPQKTRRVSPIALHYIALVTDPTPNSTTDADKYPISHGEPHFFGRIDKRNSFITRQNSHICKTPLYMSIYFEPIMGL